MKNISVSLISRDSEALIKRCLDSVKSLTDDIVVVVDDRTTDLTYEMARSITSKVYRKKFINFASQKNFATSKTKYRWVLSIDADEEVTSELVKEILELDPVHSGYLIPRDNLIFGRLIKHTNWGRGDDSHIWLFDKEKSSWSGAVHEEVQVDGSIGKLKYSKIHHSYSSISEFIEKMNKYTSLESINPNPVWEFIRRYIIHFGFLDGWRGLYLSYLMFIYHVVVWAKGLEKE